ncbi:hypothetical protein [Enterococcus phage vB_Efs6_KEN16]|uniref:Uncharacterized protein n=1 Tax=Enterococcus phage vB_Efs6_KEN16 TaxID=3138325 RepID=A0AAX4PRL7_9CAUD
MIRIGSFLFSCLPYNWLLGSGSAKHDLGYISVMGIPL